jgi:hypothetical protein
MEWKVIRYAPDYSVSNMGAIRNKHGRELLINYDRLQKTKSRARPGLSVNGKVQQYYLHRIVAEHFIENPNNLPEVNHKDGNFYNNISDNLEWISKIDNMRHARKLNLINQFKTKVKVTDKETREVTYYDSVGDCSKQLGIYKSNISKYCRQKMNHKTYQFEYEDSKRRVIDEEGVIWKEFPEFDKYLVSNTGEVKHKKNGNILSGSLVNGYRFVTLSNRTNRLVHRMVAMTFLENPENCPVVDHLDTNPLNNHVDNLKWCSYKENMNNENTRLKRNFLVVL